jgi:hypothetical protein
VDNCKLWRRVCTVRRRRPQWEESGDGNYIWRCTRTSWQTNVDYTLLEDRKRTAYVFARACVVVYWWSLSGTQLCMSLVLRD